MGVEPDSPWIILMDHHHVQRTAGRTAQQTHWSRQSLCSRIKAVAGQHDDEQADGQPDELFDDLHETLAPRSKTPTPTTKQSLAKQAGAQPLKAARSAKAITQESKTPNHHIPPLYPLRRSIF